MLDLKKILTATFINPFSDDIDLALLTNIASGFPESSKVEMCLLGVVNRGEFSSRFEVGSDNIVNFWDPIKNKNGTTSPPLTRKQK